MSEKEQSTESSKINSITLYGLSEPQGNHVMARMLAWEVTHNGHTMEESQAFLFGDTYTPEEKPYAYFCHGKLRGEYQKALQVSGPEISSMLQWAFAFWEQEGKPEEMAFYRTLLDKFSGRDKRKEEIEAERRRTAVVEASDDFDWSGLEEGEAPLVFDDDLPQEHRGAIPLTLETSQIGMAVERGPEWIYGHQGEGAVFGIICDKSGISDCVNWLDSTGKILHSNTYNQNGQKHLQTYSGPHVDVVVTPDNIFKGAKVIPAFDWCWDGQDRGALYGEVLERDTSVLPEQGVWWKVAWYDQHGNVLNADSYRVRGRTGASGMNEEEGMMYFDLAFYTGQPKITG